MNSIEEVYNRLLKNTEKDDITITLSDDKDFIEIKLSPIKYIFADDDMVQINCRKKLFKLEYWTPTKHWHPASFENLYEDLLKYLT